jgi:hypothetical protein
MGFYHLCTKDGKVMTFESSRPHIAKIQRYERRKAKFLKGFDRVLNIVTIAAVSLVVYAVLVGVTV